MAKYINVKVSLDKIIKVDTNNSEEAFETAKNIFSQLEKTPDWLSSREITFEEDNTIHEMAERKAESLYDNYKGEPTLHDIELLVNIMYGVDTDTSIYVYDEIVDILKIKIYRRF